MLASYVTWTHVRQIKGLTSCHTSELARMERSRSGPGTAGDACNPRLHAPMELCRLPAFFSTLLWLYCLRDQNGSVVVLFRSSSVPWTALFISQLVGSIRCGVTQPLRSLAVTRTPQVNTQADGTPAASWLRRTKPLARMQSPVR